MAAPSGPRVLAVCGMPFEAALVRAPGVVAVCGPGPVRVRSALAVVLAEAPGTMPDAAPGRVSGPDATVDRGSRMPVPAARGHCGAAPDGAQWAGIVSFGCAAGLDPAFGAGACIVATGVLTPQGPVATDTGWTRALLACLPGARAALLAGVDAPLATPAAKAGLWRATGAAAADMETHAAAFAAQHLGLPFAACRVVLDPARRGVPPCALAGLRPDGAIAPWAVLRALVRAPAQLCALGALARDAAVARRTLRRAGAQLGALPDAVSGLRPG